MSMLRATTFLFVFVTCTKSAFCAHIDRPGGTVTASADDYTMTIIWSPWRNGVEAQADDGVDLEILNENGTAVTWGELQLDAERRLHCMVS